MLSLKVLAYSRKQTLLNLNCIFMPYCILRVHHTTCMACFGFSFRMINSCFSYAANCVQHNMLFYRMNLIGKGKVSKVKITQLCCCKSSQSKTQMQCRMCMAERLEELVFAWKKLPLCHIMDLQEITNGPPLLGTVSSGRLVCCSCLKAQICIGEWSYYCWTFILLLLLITWVIYWTWR